MRIVALNWRDIFHPQAGGAENLVHNEALQLKRLGHEVTLVCAAYSGISRINETDEYETVRIGSRFSVYARAMSYCRKHAGRFDVIIEYINGVPWWTPLWAPIPSTAYLLHPVGRTFFEEVPFPLSAVGLSAELLVPRVYRGKPVACLGKVMAGEYVARGIIPSSIRVITPGVDHHIYSPSKFKAPTPTFVMLGPLKQYKRHDLAIKALRILLNVVPEARLIITGWSRGGTYETLVRLVDQLGLSPNVDFAGFVSTEEKVRLLREAWALVYASEREGWGLGVSEAAACGTCSIVPRVGGLTDAMADGESGLVFAPGNEEDLARSMMRIAGSFELASDLASTAQERAKDLTWERHTKSLLELFDAAIQNPNSR